MAPAVKVEIWRAESGAYLLLEDLDLIEASALTTLGACVVETREVKTKEEGIQWFTKWAKAQQPDAGVESVSGAKLRHEAMGVLAPPEDKSS